MSPEQRVAPPGARFDDDAVVDYYETNTAAFLRRGEGGSEGAIHRPVWRHPETGRLEAIHHVDACLAQQLSQLEPSGPRSRPQRFVDLGCGVGASLAYLLRRSEAEGIGLTVSPTQVELARRRLAPFAGRARVELGDFCHSPLPDDVDLAFAIEAFVHAREPTRFFDQVFESLRPGGRLVLCDDFVEHPVPAPAVAWIEEFRAGWRLASLMSTEAVDQMAEASGLRLLEDEDWTPYLALDRPRDYAIHWMVAAARPLSALSGIGFTGSRWGNYRGGNALRRSLKQGWVRYRFRVWERQA